MKTALIINRLQPNLHRLQYMHEKCEMRNVTKGCYAAEKAHFSLSCTLNYQMNATKPTSLAAHARKKKTHKKQSMNSIKKIPPMEAEIQPKRQNAIQVKVPLIIDRSQSNLQAR